MLLNVVLFLIVLAVDGLEATFFIIIVFLLMFNQPSTTRARIYMAIHGSFIHWDNSVVLSRNRAR